ncbi:DapH/DapD/GlmU-related protein [Jeongeupia sp. USM3]|uniref:acyltransferase n=1 Tax=Jeongeupia sp. USM3 TaxID=1906741 RepID=UPI00089DEDA7|nr:acyltransferase [Jeongeupia sp. USM3]AOY01890.1 hypothetical protein BJP62_16420 [Jeongeupia sp. USM3]
MLKFLKKLHSKIQRAWAESGNDRYIRYLRRKGVRIGHGVNFFDPRNTVIDITRPSLVQIGNNVQITRGFLLLTHGYDWYVLRNLYGEVYASSGRVTIGNNVFFGFNVTLLKGVSIGDNCIIGTGAVVTRSIPANSVVAGVPARVICSIDEYRDKRRAEHLAEARDYACSLVEAFGRRPVPSDFWEEFPLFLNGDQLADGVPVQGQLGASFEHYRNHHRAPYQGFEAFLQDCKLPPVNGVNAMGADLLER